jgi:pilus assembly protein CpaB
VDILVDMKVHGIDESFSKTILQNIMVMSIGQTWEQKGESKPTIVNAVTLEVTPEQAEILNLASHEGKIRLALRGRRNETTVETSGVVSSHLFAGIKKDAPPPAPLKKEKEERTVEVIKGLDRTKANL